MSEGFERREKLKNKKDFEQLFSKGKSINAYPVKLIYSPLENQIESHKIGVSAPKRNFKKAVDRNRLKRVMREAIRKQKSTLHHSENYALLFIFIGKKRADYQTVYSAVEKLFHKLSERLQNEKQ